MEELINKLLEFNRLSDREIELIKSKAQLKLLKKGDLFLEAGKIARQLGFVATGVLSVCFYDISGEEVTKIFITENHFALNVLSFHNKTPSEVYFKAISNCTLLVFSESALAELSVAIPCWNNVMSKVAAIQLLGKLKISNNMLLQDAKTRYLEFLKIYPGLANHIPLSALASYLGIRQSSLSRIRKNIK